MSICDDGRMASTGSLPDFTWLPDLALRPLGGAVIWANDETFAEKENLINQGPATFRPASFEVAVVSEARLDIYPDGGLARLRMFGDLA
jgi:allantoicase